MRKDFERLGHYLARSPQRIPSLLKLAYSTKFSSARRLRREHFASSLPPLMTIQINNLCNLRFVQCWEWGDVGAYKEVDQHVLKDEMATEQWETFIEEVCGWKPYLYFFGGELLLRKDMARIISFASSRHLLISQSITAESYRPVGVAR